MLCTHAALITRWDGPGALRGRALLRLAERAMEPQPTPPARLHAHRAGKWERNVACLLSTPLADEL